MKRTPLKRGKALRAKKSPKRAAKSKPSKESAARKRARQAKRFAVGFGSSERIEFLKLFPCLVCGAANVEAAHARSRGAGGGEFDLVPLCALHHREQHAVGVRTFNAKYGVDLKTAAAVHARLWKQTRESR